VYDEVDLFAFGFDQEMDDLFDFGDFAVIDFVGKLESFACVHYF
jgi:hypothetical protein